MSDQVSFIYHYTEINKLALILKNKTIRFNRLDRVNDLTEARIEKGIDFGKLFFVSCWTHQDEESIPLWHMYTNRMAGVRVALPRNPFRKRPFVPPESWGPKLTTGPILSPIDFADAFTDEYFILTSFLNQDHLGGPVRYVDDVQTVYKDAVNISWPSNSQFEIKIKKLLDLPRLKAECWSFEREFRFVLCILPSLPVPPKGWADPSFPKMQADHVGNCLRSGVGPPLGYKDIALSPDVLDQITVMLGPCCTEGDEILVKQLLKGFTKHGQLERSVLSGTIRGASR
jgi:hypothetical protein